MIRILPGTLNTTAHEVALRETDAAEVLNCDTGRGIWEVDKRYRRFQTHPVREYEIGEDEEFCTSYAYPAALTALFRSGQTHTFLNLSSGRLSDDAYATAVDMAHGDMTELAKGESVTPGISIALTATGLFATIKIEAQIDPDTGLAVPVVDDYVYVTSGGVNISANLATNTPIEITDTFREYECDLSALGVTVADINAGLIGAVAGWKCLPVDADAFDPANWAITYDYNGSADSDQEAAAAWASTPQGGARSKNSSHAGGPATATASSIGEITVIATWIGGGTAPTYCPLAIHSKSRWTGAGNSYGGTASNGLGDPEVAGAGSGTSEGTHTYLVPVVAGVAERIVEVSATATGTAITGFDACGASASVQVDATVTDPSVTTLKLDSIQMKFCYSVPSGDTLELGGPQGIGYGEYLGADEFTCVWGRGAFRVDASTVDEAIDDDWSAELSGLLLNDGQWSIWQFAEYLFYAQPNEAVYYREIGELEWQTLYEDSQSPGSTGDGSAQTVVPPAFEWAELDSGGGDAITDTDVSVGGPSLTPTIEADDLATITTNDWVSGSYGTGWIEFEITFATPKDMSGGNVASYRIQQVQGAVSELTGNDGFTEVDHQIELTNSAAASSGVLPAHVRGLFNVSNGEMGAMVDLSGVSDAILSDVEKLKIRFGFRQTGRSIYKLRTFETGTYLYHDTVVDLEDQVPTSGSVNNPGDLIYAYDVDEAGPGTSQARLLNIPVATHLGSRSHGAVSSDGRYVGTQQQVRVPVADSPYTAAATIQLHRKIGGTYYTVTTGLNDEALVFDDNLLDSEILADPGSYPVYVPNFEEVDPGDSGAASGINCGCAWKGSNVLAHSDGTILFSRTDTHDEFLFEGVVLTNDPGSLDLGPARTSVLADNTVSPAILLIPAENLYCFTEKECYVFVSGETAYASSYPRKVDGIRGALGMRAGCCFGDRAMVGCKDGLWALKKSTDYGEQPDSLEELTAGVRGSWAWLLGSSSSTVVVRQLLGEIWCFNEGRYLHRTRTGRWIPGIWADGREVNDAVSDSSRGLVMQMTDGSLGVLGEFKKDGGGQVDGDDGEDVQWRYRPGKMLGRKSMERVVIHWESDADLSAVSVELDSSSMDDAIDFTSVTETAANVPFEPKKDSDWQDLTLIGGSEDRVLSLEVEYVERAGGASVARRRRS